MWIAIRHGNRKVAGYFVSKGVDKFGFGFNFLHKEVKRILVDTLLFCLMSCECFLKTGHLNFVEIVNYYSFKFLKCSVL